MSGEDQNREFYKETFAEIRMREGLVEKVGRITEGDAKRRKNGTGYVMRKVAIAAAVLVALFVGSNGIAYAMTGETWVETMMVRLKLDGIEYEVDLKEKQGGNGEKIYTGTVKEADGDKSYVYVNGEDGDISYTTIPSGHIVSVNGRTFIWDEELEIDITEDLEEDGLATGTYEKNGFVKQYVVRKNGENHRYWIETLYDGMPENDWVTEWLWEDFSQEQTQGSKVEATPTPVPEQ